MDFFVSSSPKFVGFLDSKGGGREERNGGLEGFVPFGQLIAGVLQPQNIGVRSPILKWTCKSGRRLRSLRAVRLLPLMDMWILPEETASAWASFPTCTEQKPSRERGMSAAPVSALRRGAGVTRCAAALVGCRTPEQDRVAALSCL